MPKEDDELGEKFAEAAAKIPEEFAQALEASIKAAFEEVQRSGDSALANRKAGDDFVKDLGGQSTAAIAAAVSEVTQQEGNLIDATAAGARPVTRHEGRSSNQGPLLWSRPGQEAASTRPEEVPRPAYP